MVRNKAVKLTSIAFTILFGASTMHSQSFGVDSPVPVTLNMLRDAYRPLLIFTPNTNPQFLKQIRALAAGASDLYERDVVIVPILLNNDNKPWGVVFSGQRIGNMPTPEQAATRKRFHVAPNAFTVILIGKDGGEKLRSHQPVLLDTLRSTIDAMPMRQEEMRSKAPKD
jgi:hypothetical protein